MTEIPKVSICCISYNHARYLPASLDSALAQTYENIELIIVDDGSSDGSLEIARSYEARDPNRVKVFTHPGHANRGISETANLAFEKSTGGFWSGLPSDDVLYPDKIERQVQYLQHHSNIGWVYSYADYIDAVGIQLPGRFGHDITATHSPLHSLLIGNCIPGMTVLARRACIEQIGGHREDLLYSDWQFWVRLAAHARVGFMAESLVQYRVHGRNTSLGVDARENAERGLKVFESLRNYQTGELGNRRTQALIELQRAFHLFCLKQPIAAVEAVRCAARTDEGCIADYPFLQWWIEAVTREYGFLADNRDFIAWFEAELPLTNAQKLNTRLTGFRSELNARRAHRDGNRGAVRSALISLLKENPRRLLGNSALIRIAICNLVPKAIFRSWQALKQALRRQRFAKQALTDRIT